MILLRLAGGLGNQLFQLMAALVEAARTNRAVVPLTAGLGAYSVARRPDVLRLLSASRLAPPDACPAWARWAAHTARAGRWLPALGFSDRAFPQQLDRQRGWTWMDGYFQRGWSDALLAEARAQVTLAALPMPDAEDDCLMHVRGGDFLRLHSHAVLDDGFYSRCLHLAQQQGCRSFGIVTDDPAHATSLMARLAAEHPRARLRLLPPATDALADFAALRTARSRIIGNSTFAWWASALGEPHTRTWAPDQFTRDCLRDYFLPGEHVVPVLQQTRGMAPTPKDEHR